MVGVEIRDRITGLVTLRLSDRITRFVSSFESGTANGIFDMPPASEIEGDPFFYVVANLAPPLYGPIVTLSGRRISWNFEDFQRLYNRRSVTIKYGFY